MSQLEDLDKDLDYEIQRRAFAARWAVLEAGKLTWDYFQQRVDHELKADATPVTVADREAEELLRSTFVRQFPGDGFLGEEYGEEAGSTGFRWIIDPIDATKNFVRGIPFYANLVGLEYDGRCVAGVANLPGFQQLYHASKGHGAFCNDRRLQVSSVDKLADAQVIYSSIDWFDRTNTTPFFLEVARQAARTRGFGDFYGFLLIAQGSAELMLEPEISPWDIAALKPIVEEAGGVFTDWHGKDTIYGTGCIAGTPTLHRQILEMLATKPADGVGGARG